MRNHYIYLIVGIIILSMSSCTKDLYEDPIVQTARNIKIENVSLSKLDRSIAKPIEDRISLIKSAKPVPIADGRFEYNATLAIWIDTENGKLVTQDGKLYYTFQMYRESEEKLENIVFQQLDNGEVVNYFIKYNITPEEYDILSTEERENITATLQKNLYIDMSADFQCFTWWETIYWDNCDPPKIKDMIPHLLCASGGGGGGGPTSPPGNPGGSNPGTNPGGGGSGTEPIGTTPVVCPGCPELEDIERECDKITKLIAQYPSLQAELASLQLQTAATVEHGRYILKGASVIGNPSANMSGAIDFPPNPSKYVLWAHTHSSPASSTYSVFSWADLVVLEQRIRENVISVNEFVFIVSTADGTNYAVTIKDISKFSKLFARFGDANFSQAVGEFRMSLMNKYFADTENSPGNPNPIIVENGSDNIADEKAFLDFVAEGNMGLSMFEITDNFTTFTEVKHDKDSGSIIRQPCNN